MSIFPQLYFMTLPPKIPFSRGQFALRFGCPLYLAFKNVKMGFLLQILDSGRIRAQGDSRIFTHFHNQKLNVTSRLQALCREQDDSRIFKWYATPLLTTKKIRPTSGGTELTPGRSCAPKNKQKFQVLDDKIWSAGSSWINPAEQS